MRRFLVLSLVVLSVLAALSACAPLPAQAPAKGLTVDNVRSNACKTGDACGVFLTINNPTASGDVLVSAASDVAAMAGLHTVVTDAQGGKKMTPVENIPVPASGSVELKPGSLHIMLMNLKRDLKAGDTFPLTLKYQNAGDLTVQVTVKPAN